MKETYVKMISRNKGTDFPDVYCPIDVEKHSITLGLSLIGFYPENAEVIGEYDEDTDKLVFYPNYILSVNQRQMENKTK
jgi:hypothetical protein